MQTRKMCVSWSWASGWLTCLVVSLLWCNQSMAGKVKRPPMDSTEECMDSTEECILRVACTIYAEAKGESYEGKRAVASVIYTRAGDIYTMGQGPTWIRCTANICRSPAFSCWNKGWPRPPDYRRPAERRAWRVSYQLASEVVNQTFVPSVDARFYHEASIKPYWSVRMPLLCQIGNHKFYQ
jgi:spore germination cell wall hydrolase CwlJ-like protein